MEDSNSNTSNAAIKGCTWDKPNKKWIYRGPQVNGKRPSPLTLLKIDYPDGKVPSRPPDEALRLIPGYTAKEATNATSEATGKATAPSPLTPLAEYVKDWLARKNTVGKSSKNRTVACNHFLAFCEKAKLRTLTQFGIDEAERFAMSLKAQGMKPSSISTNLGFLSKLFKEAILKRLYPYGNPIVGGRAMNPVPIDDRKRYYSPEELALHLTAIKADIAAGLEKQWTYDMAIIMACTGMRASTAIAFSVDWCDFTTNTISVGKEFSKNKRAYRTGLTPQVKEIIERVGQTYGGRLVPIQSSNASFKAFRRVIKRHNLPDYGEPNHSFRHTYATLSLREKLPKDFIAGTMGQVGTKQIDHYAKLLDVSIGEVYGSFKVPTGE